jgi:hypothetical protein
MSWVIKISKAKPNPVGKDSSYGAQRQQQLLGEWVDLQNIGDESVALSRLYLAHTEFLTNCMPKDKPTIYWNGQSDQVLNPSQIVRVHTGKSAYSIYIKAVDSNGVHQHAFAESGNFVLNNDCGDIISLWWKDKNDEWQREDFSKYAPAPPEGRILVRQGEWLV